MGLKRCKKSDCDDCSKCNQLWNEIILNLQDNFVIECQEGFPREMRMNIEKKLKSIGYLGIVIKDIRLKISKIERIR